MNRIRDPYQILKQNNVKFTVFGEIETIVFDMSKCSSSIMRRIAWSASQFCEMTVIFDLRQNHSLNILRRVIHELKKQEIVCRRVVFRIEDCDEEKTIDYLIMIQQCEIENGIVLLDVLGREALSFKMESLIIEVIGMDSVRIRVNPSRQRNSQKTKITPRIKQFIGVIKIELQKLIRTRRNTKEIEEESQGQQNQESKEVVDSLTKKGIIDGLEAILSRTMSFYGSTTVKILECQSKYLEINVSNSIDISKNNKERLQMIVDSIIRQLAENSPHNSSKKTFETIKYKNPLESDSKNAIIAFSEIKDLRTIKIENKYEKAIIDLSLCAITSEIFSFQPDKTTLAISALKCPIQQITFTLFQADTSNDLATIFLQIPKANCLKDVCFMVNYEKDPLIDEKSVEICNLIFTGASILTLLKLSVSCTGKNRTSMFSFEFDRGSKTICLTPTRYSHYLIELLGLEDDNWNFLEAENLKLTLNHNYLQHNLIDIASGDGKTTNNQKLLNEIGLFIATYFKKRKKHAEFLLLDYRSEHKQSLLKAIQHLDLFSSITLTIPNLNPVSFDHLRAFHGINKISTIKINEYLFVYPSFFPSLFSSFPSLLNVKTHGITDSKHVSRYSHVNKFLILKKMMVMLLAAKEFKPVSRVETLLEIFLNYLVC